jgi:hypothetical protein
MAILSNEEALRLIKAPKNQKEIQKAKDKRIRHKLHTEAETDVNTLSTGASNFLGWVAGVLQNSGTFARFSQLFRPPYATNELVEGIFTSFEKIFESRNSFEKFEFTSPELEQDFAEYRKQIGDFNFWETQGLETFKNSIDNILVVDLPRLDLGEDGEVIQESERPEPYYYFLDIDRLIDIDNDKVVASDGSQGVEFYFFKTEYIIFRGLGKVKKADGREYETIYVFDDLAYRVYEHDGSSSPTLVTFFPHGLTYCPARSFWTTPLNSESRILKRGPITNSLSDLDWLLFFQVSERYLQLYAPFPIYAMYRNKCANAEKKDSQGRKCVNGYLELEGSRSIEGHRTECPKCKESGRVGPGHVIFIDPPKEVGGTGADPDLMANPIKIIPAETTSLNYIKERIAELKEEIRVACVGRSIDTNDAAAKNEIQVESGFESSEAILIKAKRNFEIAHEFALETVARLRYGDQFINGVVNYGDEFLQKSEGEEVEEYKTAVDAGAPTYDLAERRKDIAKARYRNDPKRQERLKILDNLEPFPDIPLAELSGMKSSGLVSEEDLIIKMQFNAFVNRFERERAPITLFGSAIDFGRKIDLIREDFIRYAQEYKAAIAPAPVVKPPVPPVPDPIPA